MEYSPERSLPILRNTPELLIAMTRGLDDAWLHSNEGEATWSVFDVVGHLLHTDRADWMRRAETILSGGNKPLASVDRFAQFEESKEKTLAELLTAFKEVRNRNIEKLLSLQLTAAHLRMEGQHPVFGTVTLSQLLATWVVHDLDHIGQIARVMAKQYKEAVGPWTAYLKIVNQ